MGTTHKTNGVSMNTTVVFILTPRWSRKIPTRRGVNLTNWHYFGVSSNTNLASISPIDTIFGVNCGSNWRSFWRQIWRQSHQL